MEGVFYWSPSAAAEFESCRRRRYWRHYAEHNLRTADSEQQRRLVKRLAKLRGMPELVDYITRETVYRALVDLRAGRTVNAESAYTNTARPLLAGCWRESRKRNVTTPGFFLREHYYRRWNRDEERRLAHAASRRIRRCIDSFVENVLPRLPPFRETETLLFRLPRDEPQSFVLEGVPILLEPDYVYRYGNGLCIHSWESSRQSVTDSRRAGLLGLWAHHYMEWPAERTLVFREWLAENDLSVFCIDQPALDRALDQVSASVADMSEYLENCDRQRNRPLPREEWELAAEPGTCLNCNFYELCRGGPTSG